MPHRIVSFGIGLAVATIAVVGADAGPAQATAGGTVRVLSATAVEYKAATGKTNSVVISVSGLTVTVTDTAKPRAGTGCVAVTGRPTAVSCTLDQPVGMTALLGDRNDRLTTTSALNLTVFGDAGNDTIAGGAGVDRLHGGTGSDKLTAGAGIRNTLYGDAGDDRLDGGPLGDTLLGAAGKDTLHGAGDRDWLDGGNDDDVLWGDAGNDSLGDNVVVENGSDSFHGGAGTDQVSYRMHTKAVTADLDGQRDDGQSGERDTIGTDVENLEGTEAADRLIGNAADNDIIGGNGDNVISGGAGNDTIRTWKGKDKLYGQAGNDRISSSGGADVIDGGPGADTIGSGNGDDTIHGGTGNDRIEGQGDFDTIYGEAGDDDLYGGSADQAWYENGGTLDGGPNATPLGDLCVAGDHGTAANCER